MLIKDWIAKEKITTYRFAKMVGCTPSYMYQHFNDGHNISPKYAAKIEAVTKGEVTRMEVLFPKDFIEKQGKFEQLTFINKAGEG